MDSQSSSFPSIYRVLRLLGSASLAGAALTLVRNKVFALYLGPSGFGVLGIMQTVISTAGNFGGCGVGYSAIRMISRARGTNRPASAIRVEHALSFLSVWLAVATAIGTAVALWGWGRFEPPGLLSPISIAAVALGAGLSILASVANTRLQGRRAAGRLALVTMGSAVVHTVVSIGAATALGEDAAAAIAAALPLSVWLVATWALKTAGGVTEMRYPPSRRIALTILRRGLPLMVPGLTESASAFVIRLLGAGVLGLATLGQVNAAQALSGFVLVTVMSAMNQDFLPRLGEASGSPERLYALASEQLLVTLQLSTPILLLLCAVSEEATQLLFSDEFVLTAELVRIMALVVVVQIATWPLHTLQTILALPSQQLLGSMANLGATAILVTVMFWNVSAFEFAGILICGELLRFAAQYVLLWRTVGIRYRRAEWFPIGLALMVLVGFDLLPADWDAIAKPTEAVLGAVWGAFALRHYRLHR